MIDLAVALRLVVDALDRTETSYVVVGSTAAAAWGVARMTRDVDLVTVVEASIGESLLVCLSEHDLYVNDHDARLAFAAGGSFNVIHPESGGKVDVFVSLPDDSFTESRLSRRVRVDVFGVSAWVATAEDVVLAKLRWRLESRSELQWRDCVDIAAVQDLDRAYLRHWGASLGVADDLDELLAAVDQTTRPPDQGG